MKDIDTSGLPLETEIDLDQWISERLPVKDAKLFFTEIMALEPNHCRDPKETTFVYGLQAAAYGNREQLGWFLCHDDYFQTLTLPKRELLAWIMENQKPPKIKLLNSYSRMTNFADLIVNLMEVCNYSKTKAIAVAIDSSLNHPTADDSLEAYDARERRAESLRVQIGRAIDPGGLVHEYFIRRTNDIREHHEEMKKLRDK